MDTTVEAPCAQTPAQIGKFEFQYALSNALVDQPERRVEALTVWLYAEWKREQEREVRA